jgi:hypothetical protein
MGISGRSDGCEVPARRAGIVPPSWARTAVLGGRTAVLGGRTAVLGGRTAVLGGRITGRQPMVLAPSRASRMMSAWPAC